MIELSDSVINLNLGLNEYKALRSMGIGTIRQLLLLDITKVTMVHRYSRIIADGISDWQKLLRRYLTYEKLHAARKIYPADEDKIHIHDPIADSNLEKSDTELLNSLGIHSIIDFLNANLTELFEGRGIDSETALRVMDDQNEMLSPPEVLPVPEYSDSAEYFPEEPVKVLTVEEFIKEPLTETELGESEIELLCSYSVRTVEDFLGADLDKILSKEEKKIQLRLFNWQKYLQKNLGAS